MKLIDMKNTVKTKDSSLVSPMEQDEYPWGLRISLDSATLAKLGITDLPAIDSEHKLVALVCVVGVSQHERADGEASRNVDLQIEQMMLMPAKEEDDDEPADRAKAMYPTMLG